MPKVKVNVGTPEQPEWITMDANNGDTVDGVHFRVSGGRLQFSINNTDWSNAGTDTSDADALAGHILQGKTAYVNDQKITGTMANYAGATDPNSAILSNIVTVDLGQGTGDHRYGTVHFKSSISGYIDQNTVLRINAYGLDPSIVKAGAQVGGGNTQTTGTFTADASATASQILSGYTAYANGNKLTGTLTNRNTGQYTSDSISVSGNTLRFSVPGGAYYGNGAQIQYTDNNWVPQNIKKGVSVFGKTGTLNEKPTFGGTLATDVHTQNVVNYGRDYDPATGNYHSYMRSDRTIFRQVYDQNGTYIRNEDVYTHSSVDASPSSSRFFYYNDFIVYYQGRLGYSTTSQYQFIKLSKSGTLLQAMGDVALPVDNAYTGSSVAISPDLAIVKTIRGSGPPRYFRLYRVSNGSLISQYDNGDRWDYPDMGYFLTPRIMFAGSNESNPYYKMGFTIVTINSNATSATWTVSRTGNIMTGLIRLLAGGWEGLP